MHVWAGEGLFGIPKALHAWRAMGTLSALHHGRAALSLCVFPACVPSAADMGTHCYTCRASVQQHSSSNTIGSTGSADFFTLFNSGLSHCLDLHHSLRDCPSFADVSLQSGPPSCCMQAQFRILQG